MTGNQRWVRVQSGQVPYEKAQALQQQLVAARRQGHLAHDLLWLLEHPPVYTLGRRGGREFFCVPPSHLERHGIQVVDAERGGVVTYHGPGQQVGYPIVNLERKPMGVRDYVYALEEIMRRTALDFGVDADRDDRNRGVWVGPAKLGSVGIAIRRGITFHGFALNIDVDLTPFEWIHPCGLENVQVTSLAAETGQSMKMAAVRKALSRHTMAVFNIEQWTDLADETLFAWDGQKGLE